MASNNEFDFYASLFRGPMDNVLDTLSMLMLIDIGLIIEVDGEGRAVVQTSKATSNVPVLLTNVEIVYPGNNNGAFTSSCAGSMGLIFAPRTVMPNIHDGKINATLPEYNIHGIKVLPISNGRKLSVNHCFDADGSLHIHTEKYSFNFDVDGFDFNSVAGMFLTVTKDNTVTLYRRNVDSGILNFNISNNGITSKFTNTDASSTYSMNMLDDGTLTLEHQQPQADGSDPKSLNKITIMDNGSVTIASGTEDKTTTITIDTEGKITLSSKSDVGIETEGKITVKAKGDLGIETEGNLSLKGANVTIDGALNINNGNLEVSK